MRNQGSFLLMASSCIWALPATAQVTAADFVGTWELASIESPAEAGGWGLAAVPFAGMPVGVIMYDALGNMAVQITSEPRGVETPAEQPEIVNGYVAYYGKYEVDSGAGTVTHHRRGHVNPALAELSVVRYYEFSGDTLTLTLAPDRTLRLKWVRQR
jgi:catechol 1,2-dioxygenase